MQEKIDQLALDVNFLDASDIQTIKCVHDDLVDVRRDIGSKNELIDKLLATVINFVSGVIEGSISFESLEDRVSSLINILILNEGELTTKKKKIALSAELENNIRQVIEKFTLNETGMSSIRETEKKESDQKASVDDGMDFINDKQLFIDFIVEARDHLAVIEESILGLEENPHDSGKIDAIFRAFHTIKGVALFLRLKQIGELAHKTESALDKVRNKVVPFSSHVADVMFSVRDKIISMMDALEQNLAKDLLKESEFELFDILNDVDNIFNIKAEADKSPESKSEDIVKKNDHTSNIDNSIKVDYLKIDHLINYTGELLIAQSLLWNNNYILGNNDQKFLNIIEQIKRISSELQKISLSMRMVPIKQTFSKMQRIVRDLSHKLQKQVKVVLIGEDTELDRSLIESINDPLVHLVRNSIDHGLENPEERKKSGKPEFGTIHLKAYHQGGSIVIEVSDDGKGLNKERILAKALEKELIKDSTGMSDQSIWQLIMEPGFSTAENLTDVSGRGVGMDVVKSNVDKLRGRVDIYSKSGEGTTMTLRIPLTLAIILGMIVTIGGEYYIIPLQTIMDILRPQPGQIHSVEHKNEVLLMRGETIPIIRLYKMLNIENARTNPNDALLIVVEFEGKHKALMVDDILGQQEVVIKSIYESLNERKFFSGCSILGNGKASLILNMGRFFSLE
ncbi:MAG: chemotaxis protein CheA [Candidatus Margulisbacteria bacterium]|nr:chemotaxis protein CheA [Candidatus Margulisiibacteriota bacterium]